jgi:hypothetical protein
METLQEMGTSIPLRMGVLRHVRVFGPSVLCHIIRDTGAWLEVSTPIFMLWPSEPHLEYIQVKRKAPLFRQSSLLDN